jgi:hypothetical protein
MRQLAKWFWPREASRAFEWHYQEIVAPSTHVQSGSTALPSPATGSLCSWRPLILPSESRVLEADKRNTVTVVLYMVICHLIMGICSEKCVVRLFHHSATVQAKIVARLLGDIIWWVHHCICDLSLTEMSSSVIWLHLLSAGCCQHLPPWRSQNVEKFQRITNIFQGKGGLLHDNLLISAQMGMVLGGEE